MLVVNIETRERNQMLWKEAYDGLSNTLTEIYGGPLESQFTIHRKIKFFTKVSVI
jgi:regulation of enolase protein 1 (concanavalin A-like superfamily)